MTKVIPIIKKVFGWIFKLLFGLFVLSIFMVILYRFVPPPITPLMMIRCYQQKKAGKDLKLKKEWVSLDNIAPDLQLALVAGEDNNFLTHNGFDFEAIKKAMEYNKEHPKETHGASTISQQTAKNVFLWDGRTYLRKGLEVYFTFLIETFWSKKRIMEVYLNEIEMGDGIYGAEAASQAYYKKPAKNLSRGEAASICAIVPSPRYWSPVNPNGSVLMRKEAILWNMNNIVKVDYDHPIKYEAPIPQPSTKK
jgi:monofunctional biosynthetic peptidoglycan transglycosylase